MERDGRAIDPFRLDDFKQSVWQEWFKSLNKDTAKVPGGYEFRDPDRLQRVETYLETALTEIRGLHMAVADRKRLQMTLDALRSWVEERWEDEMTS